MQEFKVGYKVKLRNGVEGHISEYDKVCGTMTVIAPGLLPIAMTLDGKHFTNDAYDIMSLVPNKETPSDYDVIIVHYNGVTYPINIQGAETITDMDEMVKALMNEVRNEVIALKFLGPEWKGFTAEQLSAISDLADAITPEPDEEEVDHETGDFIKFMDQQFAIDDDQDTVITREFSERPMNMTPNQQDTVQMESVHISAMLDLSGTNIVLGYDMDDNDTVLLHHEDSAEPTYMSRREARILGEYLLSIAEQ